MAILKGKALRVVPTGLVLREEDERECQLAGLTGREAVAQSVGNSLESFGVYVEEELIAMWGYAPSSYLGGVCSVWLLTTLGCAKYPFHFLKTSKDILSALLARYTSIQAETDARYLKAVAWMKWLGFKVVGERQGFLVMRAER